jgi:murein DD-endopeptidase MepM/ murein hydrolase activator NlpD
VKLRSTITRAIVPIATAVLVVAGMAPAPAGAEPLVQQTIRERHRIHRAILKLRREEPAAVARFRAMIIRAENVHLGSPVRSTGTSVRKWRFVRDRIAEDIRMANRRIAAVDRRVRQRLRFLVNRKLELKDWLEVWAVFRVCPVDEPSEVRDDYGTIVDLPGVPVHVHRGNDISAPWGTPIRAPFDGYAWSDSSYLGGFEVRVRGDDGYVYNAHLAGFGKLGDVHAGDIVGYVGAGGDATASHDHFEWHPWDGAAVDPNPYLSVVC